MKKTTRLSINREWVVKSIHIPLLKRNTDILNDQYSKLGNGDFCVGFYSKLDADIKAELHYDDCFLLIETVRGYLKNFNKSLNLIIFCLENAPVEIQNSLALQSRSLLELSGVLYFLSQKELKERLDIARMRRLRSLSEKIQSSAKARESFTELYDKQLDLIVRTAPEFEKYRKPETLSYTHFNKSYGKFTEHVSYIKASKDSVLKRRLNEKYFVWMYEYFSSFVHGDPLSNRGAADQPIWFSTVSFYASLLTIELIDKEIFSYTNRQAIEEIIKDYDKYKHLFNNLEPLKAEIDYERAGK